MIHDYQTSPPDDSIGLRMECLTLEVKYTQPLFDYAVFSSTQRDVIYAQCFLSPLVL